MVHVHLKWAVMGATLHTATACLKFPLHILFEHRMCLAIALHHRLELLTAFCKKSTHLLCQVGDLVLATMLLACVEVASVAMTRVCGLFGEATEEDLSLVNLAVRAHVDDVDLLLTLATQSHQLQQGKESVGTQSVKTTTNTCHCAIRHKNYESCLKTVSLYTLRFFP